MRVLIVLAFLAAPQRTYQRQEVLRIAEVVYACGKIDGAIELQQSLVPWSSEAQKKRFTDARAHARCEEVDKLLKEAYALPNTGGSHDTR